MEKKKFDVGKYIIVFFLTLLIFFAGFLASYFLNQERISNLSQSQQDLNLDLLSLETQFSVLKEAPCDKLSEATLTLEIYNTFQKLEYISQNFGKNNPDFIRLKKYYSLLELKHWMLLKKAVENCNWNYVFILYFYSEEKDCPDCQNQGTIISYLRDKYYFVRTYSFDWDLELSALDSLKSIYSLQKDMPILIINGEVYHGFKTKEELQEIILSMSKKSD